MHEYVTIAQPTLVTGDALKQKMIGAAPIKKKGVIKRKEGHTFECKLFGIFFSLLCQRSVKVYIILMHHRFLIVVV